MAFCSKCGASLPPDAVFCGRCGQRVGPTTAVPGGVRQVAESPQPGSTTAPPLTANVTGPVIDRVLLRYERVFIERTLLFYRLPDDPRLDPLQYEAATVQVTSNAIIFLDGAGRPLSHRIVSPRTGFAGIDLRLSYFWVLAPRINENLDREFRENPSAYLKVGGPYMTMYSRNWNYVHSSSRSASSCLELMLGWVQATSHTPRPGTAAVTSLKHGLEGTAKLFLRSGKEVEELQGFLGNIVNPKVPPFTQEYMNSLPPTSVSSIAAITSNATALYAYIPVAGWVIAIAFLLLEPWKKDKFVRFHALQSILLSVLYFGILAIPFLRAFGVLGVTFIVFQFFLMFKAGRGERFTLPIIGRLAARLAG